MGYLFTVTNCFLDEDFDLEKTQEKQSTLFELISQIILFENANSFVLQYMAAILNLILEVRIQFGLSVGLVSLLTSLVALADADCMFENGALSELLVGNLKNFYKSIEIHRCEGEALLCACCLALTHAPNVLHKEYINTLYALEIIFSRNNVEPQIFNKSLKKFENLLQMYDLKSNETCQNIISQICKLKYSNIFDGKDGRTLKREILIFLGTYGYKISNKSALIQSDSHLNMLMLKLKEGPCLSVANFHERNQIKINLQIILHLALTKDDVVVLNSLLIILASELSNRKDSRVQTALTTVIVALANCHSRGDSVNIDSVQGAVKLCDRSQCVKDFIYHISISKSPGVRKMLCNLLEIAITLESHSDATETALITLFDWIDIMLQSDCKINKMAALDLVETLISGFKENNEITKKYLKNLIKSILITNEINTMKALEISTELFIEKTALFQENLLEFSNDIFHILLRNNYENIYLKILIKHCLLIINKCYKISIKDCSDFIGFKNIEISKDPIKNLYIFTEAKNVFEFNKEESIKLLATNNFMILNTVQDAINLQKTCVNLEIFSTEILFEFFGTFHKELIEVKYQETLKLLSTLIYNLKPTIIIKKHKIIRKCINEYSIHWHNMLPKILTETFEKWCDKIPIEKISENIINLDFNFEDSIKISALKKLIYILKPNCIINKIEFVKKWWRNLQNLRMRNYFENNLKADKGYLNDICAVSFYFLTKDEGKGCLLDHQDGINFTKFFIGTFSKSHLVNLLCDVNETVSYEILNEILIYYGRNRCDTNICIVILNLFEKLWPKFQSQLDFLKLHTILSNVCEIDLLKITFMSPSGKWWLQEMLTQGIEEKVKLMQVVCVFLKDFDPNCEEEYSAAMNAYSTILPIKITMRDDLTAIHAAIQSLSVTGDGKLLELVMSTIAGENIPKELETSIQDCMKSLAAKQNIQLIYNTYKNCEKFEVSIHLYERVLIPLLSYSSQAILESFFASIMQDILDCLWKASNRAPKLVKCARACILAKCAYDMLPLSLFEDPNSTIYAKVKLNKSKNLSAELMKLCTSLISKMQCEDIRDVKYMKIFRYFHIANYNCIAAILLKKQLGDFKFYKYLFQKEVWPLIIDCEKEYIVYIEALGRTNLKRHLAGRSDSPAHHFNATLTPSMAMTRRTLSDNPFQYDFMKDCSSEVFIQPQEIILTDNVINAHPSASVLSSVIKQLYLNQTDAATDAIVSILKGDFHRNIKWFLCQVLINSKESLHNHINEYFNIFLQVIVDTTYRIDEKQLLNGLHINMLNTIVQWNEDCQSIQVTDETRENINTCISFLIATAIHHRQRNSVFKAILNTINGFCSAFNNCIKIKWSLFGEYLKDSQNDIACLDILLAITKNNIYIPELLPDLTLKFNSKYVLGNRLSNMAQLLGQALSCCPESVKTDALSKFWQLLDRVANKDHQDYVKILFYCQLKETNCCNEINFRRITDYAPKMIRESKNKCFLILSNYIEKIDKTNEYVSAMFETIDLSESLVGENCYNALYIVKCGLHLMEDGLKRHVVYLVGELCASPVVKIRKMAFEVLIKAFGEKITKSFKEPPHKLIKKEYPTAILNLITEEDIYAQAIGGRLGAGLTDDSEEICLFVRDNLAKLLCKENMGIRFLEITIIAIYLPLTFHREGNASIDNVDARICLSAILDLWYRGVTSQDGFQMLKLRDDPLPELSQSENQGPSKLLTLSHTYQGTFKTPYLTSGRSNRRTITKASSGINVQITLKEIIDSFIKFSEVDLDTASTLYIDTIKLLKRQSNMTSVNFDECLSRVLVKCLSSGVVNELSPCVLGACRLIVDCCCKVDGFRSAIERMLVLTKCTEGEIICNILYEDIMIMEKTYSYVLGNKPILKEDVDMRDLKTEDFRLQELSQFFDKLSNWDELTYKHRRHLSTSLPVVWTSYEHFHDALVDYEGPVWLSRMKSVILDADVTYAHTSWLKEVDRWPRNQFCISAITEATKWRHINHEEMVKNLPYDVGNKDCLVSWAVRLMARADYINKLTIDNDCDPSTIEGFSKRIREQELFWCQNANKKGLGEIVLQCVQRNISKELMQSETLAWLLQHSTALRNVGLRNNDSSLVKKALDKIESFSKDFIQHSTTDVATGVFKLQFILSQDLKLLSDKKIDDLLKEVDEQNYLTDSDEILSVESKNNIVSCYEVCLRYFDETWAFEDKETQIKIIENMTNITKKINDIYPNILTAYINILLNRIMDFNIHILPEHILTKVGQLIKNLPQKHIEVLRHIPQLSTKLSAQLLNAKLEGASERFKQCLQLICYPEHCLNSFIEKLNDALKNKDEQKWRTIYDNMLLVFGNNMAGSAFQLLANRVQALKTIQTYEPTQDFLKETQKILHNTYIVLTQNDIKSTLNLQSLCPFLTDGVPNMSEEDSMCLSRLLLGTDQVRIVKFSKEVKVFTNSIRRPCVLKAILSTGYTRRFLVKRGEPLRVDAAFSNVYESFNQCSGYKVKRYDVTPLSDDCGIIEYLEDHVTLRSLIEKKYNLNEISSSARVSEMQIAQSICLSRSASMSQYQAMCDKLPACALRSAIENECVTFKDFIDKRNNFLNSVAAMTVLHWIFGLGDRHLENFLYSTIDGAVCGIDHANAFSFGVCADPELPVARLTRNIVAMCDVNALESRLQTIVSTLRKSATLFVSNIRVNFVWQKDFNSEDFQHKLKCSEDLLKGLCLPHQVVSKRLSRSEVKHKQLYIQLLEDIFKEQPFEDIYDVETQVACLLRQCTDPKILCVTRPGWEAWI